MWKIKQVTVRNLFSHKMTVFNPQQNTMTMLLGVNKTEAGANSNGSGKSTIIEGITLAITGDVFRGVKRDDFIRRGQEECTVYLKLDNPVLNRTMSIKRTFYLNKSSKVLINIDGEVKFESGKDRTKKTDPDIIIFEELGITKEDFLNYFVIGQGNRNSFFTCGDTKQKAIISRFSNFDKLDEAVLEMKTKIYDLDNVLAECSNRLATVKGKINAVEEHITEIKDGFEAEQEEARTNIRRRLQKAAETLVSLKESKTAAEARAEVLAQKVEELKGKKEDSTELEKAKGVLEQEIAKYQKAINQANRRKGELSNLQGQVIQCPGCDKKFIPESDVTPAQVKQETEQLDKDLAGSKELLEEAKQTLIEAEAKLEAQKTLRRQLRNTENELQEVNETLTDFTTQYESAKQRKADIAAELEEIKTATIEDKIDKLKIKLDGYYKQAREIESEVSDLEKQRERFKFFEFHFGKKGLKTFLANRSIRNIQDICNYYLKKFDSDLQVIISGYKTNKNGDLRDEIEVSVVTEGTVRGLFNKYSGGEKSRVDLSGTIAINRLINNSAPHGKGLDFIALDENVSYLDERGLTEVIRILNRLDQTVLLVMHHATDIPYEHKVYIEKVRGISKIREQ